MGGTRGLRGRKRAPLLRPLTFLLVLSYGVWLSKQCPIQQPTGNNIPGVGESDTSNDGVGSYNSGGASIFGGGGSGHPQKKTNERLKDEVFHFCQKRLTDELNKVCDGEYHDPNYEYNMERARALRQNQRAALGRSFMKRGVMEILHRRVPRSLVDECCTKACTRSHVQRYCKHGSANGTTTTPRPVVEEVTPETEEKQLQSLTQTQSQNRSPTKPESELYYPLLHIFKIMIDTLGPTKPPRVTLSSTLPPPPPEDRDLPLPQARIQDPSKGARQSQGQLPFGQPFPNGNSGSGFSGINAISVPVNQPSFDPSPRMNIQQPFRPYQQTEWGHGQKSGYVGTSRNMETITLPPQLINLKGGDDYVYLR